MAINDRIKEARLKKKYTQEQLANLIGVAKTTVTGYEKGNSEPSIETIGKIMSALDVDANYLWQDEGNFPMQVSYDEMQHIKKYRNLDNHGRELVDLVLSKEHQRLEDEYADISPMPNTYRHILYYEHLTTSSLEQFIFDDLPIEIIEIPNIPDYKKVKYAIGINGDNMEPEFYEGDKLLVEPTDTIDYGEIGFFVAEENAFIKKLGKNELISVNGDCANIPLTPKTKCVGRIIGKISNLDTLSEEDLNTLKNGVSIEDESSLVQNW